MHSASTVYYPVLCKDALEAGKERLSGDTVRESNIDEACELKRENGDLKQTVAEPYLLHRRAQKSLTGQGVIFGDIGLSICDLSRPARLRLRRSLGSYWLVGRRHHYRINDMNNAIGGVDVGEDDISAIDRDASICYDYRGCSALYGRDFFQLHYLCS